MLARVGPYRVILAVVDATAVAVLLLLAAVAHFYGKIPSDVWDRLQTTIPLAAACLVGSNVFFGLYNRIWRYATAETAVAIGVSVTTSQVAAALVGKWATGALPIPVWATAWLGTLIVIGAVRFAWRFLRPYLRPAGEASNDARKRVIIYGAGDSGYILMRQFRKEGNGKYELVGFVDDDPAIHGAIVGYMRVLGGGKDLPSLVAQHRVTEVILAMPSAGREEFRRAYAFCREAKIPVRVLPSLLEMMEEPSLRQVRPMRIEDLLGRDLALEEIRLHENYLADKTVLITGAGGSIGSELARQVCRHSPRRVILLGRGENRIHWIYLQLSQLYPEIDILPVIANVTVASSIEKILDTFRPEIIIHAAAHKHVYLMEHVPVEAVRNNVLGTEQLAALAEKYGVERFIVISTDKAAAPTNVMGATKRMVEMICTQRPYAGTDFICVRFGNVLGSEGSVLEIFKRQWEQSQPLTVTHPETTRYFMSIPEACFLALQSGAIGQHSSICLLRMGHPVRILDLAKEFITLQGGDPDLPGTICFTQLRPGERLHETLVDLGDDVKPTQDSQIDQVVINGRSVPWQEVQEQLSLLAAAVEAEDEEGACRILSEATNGQVSPENCLCRRGEQWFRPEHPPLAVGVQRPTAPVSGEDLASHPGSGQLEEPRALTAGGGRVQRPLGKRVLAFLALLQPLPKL